MGKNWRSSGFTLTEVIVTVAVIGILAALGIPSLNNLLRDIKMAELDNSAKQIYLLAQNRLVSMRESSLLEDLSGSSELGSVDLNEDGETVSYHVASNALPSSTVVGKLLPGGVLQSQLADDGHCLIVFLKGNKGLMREVYYSEEANIFDSWSAAQLEAWRTNPTERRNARIGFFDGGAVDINAIRKLESPLLEVINNEVLELRVVLPNSVVASKTVMEITVTDLSDESNQEHWTLACNSSIGNFDRMETIGGKTTYIKVLDQLFETGKDFASVCPSITLGADIRLSVILKPAAADSTLLPSDPSIQDTNSLFAKTAWETRMLSDDGKSAPHEMLQFQISSGRHLQNLELLRPTGYSDPAQVVHNMNLKYPADSGKSRAEKCFSVSQTGDIDWSAAYPGKSFISINSGADYSQYYGLSFFSGNSRSIKGIRITGDAVNGCGLFGNLLNLLLPSGYSGEVNGVRLVDPYINVNATNFYSSLGILVGMGGNIKVSDCHVYVEDTANKEAYQLTGTGRWLAIGGLVGLGFYCRITYSSVSLPSISGYANSFGGLAGFIQDRTSLVENSYANISKLSSTAAAASGCQGMGMLVGNTDSPITLSYALGTMTGKANNIAGLVGGKSDSSKETVKSSYVIVSYDAITTDTEIQAITQTNSDKSVNCYYAFPGGSPSGGTVQSGAATEVTLAGLKTMLVSDATRWKLNLPANPYNAALGNKYIYPGLTGLSGSGMIHYGDWPT